ncbi:hypothetical protein O181_104373 [Austropuccinia psidii MF-1]|uniref:Uncharacterized protein n=1 Tax=Austropuccinia psidii MF-1 TaxID=1389203 RepID=A0A9Q3JM46_9BASI|nr:hypothetical protein [Austropuccinia psidii MF-1]
MCGGSGHLANNCLEKAKINEIVETKDHNDKEVEFDYNRENEESETYGSDEINMTNFQINNIYFKYEVLDLNSNLPQILHAFQIYRIPNYIEPNLKMEWAIQLENQV